MTIAATAEVSHCSDLREGKREYQRRKRGETLQLFKLNFADAVCSTPSGPGYLVAEEYIWYYDTLSILELVGRPINSTCRCSWPDGVR